MAENDRDFLTRLGIDAQKWAKAFVELQAGRTVEGSAPDENDHLTINVGTMIAWFANAIMAGWDRGMSKGAERALEAFVRDYQANVRQARHTA